MKKLLLILPVMALTACGHEANTYVDGCERIAERNLGGNIYKCPMTEDLVAIKAMEADSMFGSHKGLDVIAAAADTENAYVNVFGGKCETKGQVSYRVIVTTPKALDNGKTYYAVEVCR